MSLTLQVQKLVPPNNKQNIKNLKHGSFKVQVLGGTPVGCSPVFPPEWRNISSEMFPWPACKQKVTDLSIIKSLLPDDLPKVTKN